MSSSFRETLRLRLVCVAFALPCLAAAVGLLLLAAKIHRLETGGLALLRAGSLGVLGLGLLLASLALIRVVFQPSRDF
jgi:hypothetical protein